MVLMKRHFDIKSWVTCWTKIRQGKVDNWKIFESNWLNVNSQIDSTLRVKLTQHWEPNSLNIESQIHSTLRVKFTQHWESNWLKHWESNWLNIESQIDSNILQLLTLPGRIIIPPVTQLLRSKWLNFFSRSTERKNSHFDKKLGQILVPPVTQLFRPKWLNFFQSVHWEKNWVIFWPEKLGQILVLPVTQLLGLKWLNYFSRCTERKLSHFYLISWVKF